MQNRLAWRGAGAARAAEEWPTHFVAFDLSWLSGTETTGWPYRRRRAALESVFAARRLSAPWALCPSTTEADVVREWLTWASVGMEGVVFMRLDGACQPSVRGWEKCKVREKSEAIVGAITGSRAAPRTLLLGRYNTEGRFQYVDRTTWPRRQVQCRHGFVHGQVDVLDQADEDFHAASHNNLFVSACGTRDVCCANPRHQHPRHARREHRGGRRGSGAGHRAHLDRPLENYRREIQRRLFG